VPITIVILWSILFWYGCRFLLHFNLKLGVSFAFWWDSWLVFEVDRSFLCFFYKVVDYKKLILLESKLSNAKPISVLTYYHCHFQFFQTSERELCLLNINVNLVFISFHYKFICNIESNLCINHVYKVFSSAPRVT